MLDGGGGLAALVGDERRVHIHGLGEELAQAHLGLGGRGGRRRPVTAEASPFIGRLLPGLRPWGPSSLEHPPIGEAAAEPCRHRLHLPHACRRPSAS